jgi:predicted anti-sigma-YlaC factor YlaD
MSHSLPPTERQDADCGWIDERLDLYVDGELSAFEEARVERHLSSCEACGAVVTGLRGVKASLGGLPVLRCPERVLEAVRREALPTEVASQPLRTRRLSNYAVGLAACLLVAAGAWSIRGAVERRQAEQRRERIEMAIADLQTTLRQRATDVGREAFVQGVAKPTRTVVTAVQNGPLGRWGAAAASLLAPEEADETDAT